MDRSCTIIQEPAQACVILRYIDEGHRTFDLTSTRLYLYRGVFLERLFNSKNVELLTESGGVVVYYIQP